MKFKTHCEGNILVNSTKNPCANIGWEVKGKSDCSIVKDSLSKKTHICTTKTETWGKYTGCYVACIDNSVN